MPETQKVEVESSGDFGRRGTILHDRLKDGEGTSTVDTSTSQGDHGKEHQSVYFSPWAICH